MRRGEEGVLLGKVITSIPDNTGTFSRSFHASSFPKYFFLNSYFVKLPTENNTLLFYTLSSSQILFSLFERHSKIQVGTSSKKKVFPNGTATFSMSFHCFSFPFYLFFYLFFLSPRLFCSFQFYFTLLVVYLDYLPPVLFSSP